ncbi:MAG: ankyrin repeat domain-containing protein, partial [Asticcacaulis sp.]|nr:ankyrin repeat domain-containing protein [Asticcacaulis sp.]
ADVNIVDGHGRTALHYAVEAGAAEMVSLLLLAGGDGDVADTAGDTPLHLAAVGGRDLIARDILASGADPKAINSVGFSGLHILAEKQGVEMTPAHLRLADALIRAGGDLTQTDNRGYTPLVAAAAAGNIPIAAVFVAHHADVSADSSAALRLAVLYEDNDMTDLLLKAGALPDIAAGTDEERPLHTAAQEGFVHGIRVLLDHGADIEARNIDGETPLLIAARRQKYSAVALLTERGASLAAQDHYGCSVLTLAGQRNDTHLAKLLQSRVVEEPLLVHSSLG